MSTKKARSTAKKQPKAKPYAFVIGENELTGNPKTAKRMGLTEYRRIAVAPAPSYQPVVKKKAGGEWVLTIGCHEDTVEWWRSHAVEVIRDNLGDPTAPEASTTALRRIFLYDGSNSGRVGGTDVDQSRLLVRATNAEGNYVLDEWKALPAVSPKGEELLAAFTKQVEEDLQEIRTDSPAVGGDKMSPHRALATLNAILNVIEALD